MKKIAPTLLLTLAFGMVSTVSSAIPIVTGGGVVAIAVLAFGGDHKSSKDDAKAPSKLEGEFAALNSSPDNSKLMQQSAGGSADLKTILN